MKTASYRDILTEYFGPEIGSVVGCGLDRAGGYYTGCVQDKAIAYYENNKHHFKKLAIGDRREAISEFVNSGKKREGFI